MHIELRNRVEKFLKNRYQVIVTPPEVVQLVKDLAAEGDRLDKLMREQHAHLKDIGHYTTRDLPCEGQPSPAVPRCEEHGRLYFNEDRCPECKKQYPTPMPY